MTSYQEVRLEEDEGRNRRVGEGKKEEGKESRNEGEKKGGRKTWERGGSGITRREVRERE